MFANNFTNIRNQRPGPCCSSIPRDENPFNLTALNPAAFDRHANYSRIWYQQTNKSISSTVEAGELAARQIMIFPVPDCESGSDTSSIPAKQEPYYSWSCQSEESGSCYSTPHKIRSFWIGSTGRFPDSRVISATRWR